MVFPTSHQFSYIFFFFLHSFLPLLHVHSLFTSFHLPSRLLFILVCCHLYRFSPHSSAFLSSSLSFILFPGVLYIALHLLLLYYSYFCLLYACLFLFFFFLLATHAIPINHACSFCVLTSTLNTYSMVKAAAARAKLSTHGCALIKWRRTNYSSIYTDR